MSTESDAVAAARQAVLEQYARFMRALHCGAAEQAPPWVGLYLTLPQLKVLGLLACRPEGMHGRELARVVGVGPSAVTALVERLVEAGYTCREEDPRDRRIVWIRLTARGRELVEQMIAGRRERLSRLLEQLQPDDLALVRRALEILCLQAERL